MIRFQHIFSITLLTAMMWNVLYVPLTYAYYYVDQPNFIEQFCINIDKPKMKCNGKCHLNEVSKKDTTNDKAPLKMVTTKDITLFVLENEKIDFGFIIYIKKQDNKYQNLYSYLGEYTLYHPPQVSLT
ncbi:MAG: hypothetical protein L3J09_11120 [Flavobacteriaceae bacterium]|nr:hypothetical protein [Flavobacteriaceae bacterium]